MRTLTHLRELLRLPSEDVFPESLDGYVLAFHDQKSSIDVAVRSMPCWALTFLINETTQIQMRVSSETAQ